MCRFEKCDSCYGALWCAWCWDARWCRGPKLVCVCVCVRVLGNVWGLLSVVDWRDIFSWSWMVVRAWDMGMLAQMVVVLVRFECLLKDWFEDGCCQKNVNWGCVWDAVPIACSQGCFSLFLLCVSYCCCARCAWSRGCRSMYRSEADFSDETHLCYLLRHLSTSDVCLSDVLFSVCFWNHNVTMMNWMPKCNSWNFLVCQKCCFGCWALWREHFFFSSMFLGAHEVFVRLGVAQHQICQNWMFPFFLHSECVSCVAVWFAFSSFGWVIGQFHEDHPKGCFTTCIWGCARPNFVVCVENSLCCELGKVILSWQVRTHVRVWPTKFHVSCLKR